MVHWMGWRDELKALSDALRDMARQPGVWLMLGMLAAGVYMLIN